MSYLEAQALMDDSRLSDPLTVDLRNMNRLAKDIFRREDVPKLEEYIRKQREEFRLIGDKPVPYIYHAIHAQNFYLDKQHKARLKEEYPCMAWFEARTWSLVAIRNKWSGEVCRGARKGTSVDAQSILRRLAYSTNL
ncbi:unnamed protein product [Calypogeia fissa]